MSFIESIPNEILSSALSHLGKADLLATSLVSRHFCTLSQSFLYKDIDLPFLFNEYQCRLMYADPGQESLGLFLRTLLLSPARETLAHYVQALSVELELGIESYAGSPAMDELAAAASGLGYGGHPLTIKGAQFTLLLRLLPRLTSIDLRVHNREGIPPGPLQDSLMCLANPHVSLRNIRVFKCIENIYSTHITPLMLLVLLGLPSIREISVCVRADSANHKKFKTAAAIAVGTSHATNLFLAPNQLPPHFVIEILQIPKSLTHFSCTPHRPVDRSDDHVPLLAQALALHKSSLAKLDLNYSDTLYLGTWKNGKTIGTFHGWPALRTLRLPLVMVLGKPADTSLAPALADILPRGLRSLFTYDDRFWSGEKLVTQLLAYLPRCELHNLTVVLRRVVLGPQLMQMLDSASREAGVQLAVGVTLFGSDS